MYTDDFNAAYAKANDFYKKNLPNRSTMTAEKRAIFNDYENLLDIVNKDGSNGVHNPEYLMSILARLAEIEEGF
jgi:hypothetical protein